MNHKTFEEIEQELRSVNREISGVTRKFLMLTFMKKPSAILFYVLSAMHYAVYHSSTWILKVIEKVQSALRVKIVKIIERTPTLANAARELEILEDRQRELLRGKGAEMDFGGRDD